MTILTKALGFTNSAAAYLGLLDKPLDPDELIRLAQKATGLRDFGDTGFFGPMTRWLNACSTESSLSIVGRTATRWDAVRFLSNLLVIQEAFSQLPELAETPVHAPIFITGLPRSGTTFLHRLMLTDPANRAPAVWETIYPSPLAGTRERRIARVTRQLRAFERLAPEFRSLHPLEATSPQECSEITAHVFRSLRFDTNYHIPSYRTWMDADVMRHLPAYRFHKRFLQYLQRHNRSEQRWVLKCPEHIFALDVIRTIYPDAKMVFVHRDPVKVLLSQAKLTEVLRRPFTRKLDPETLGPLESCRWLDGTQRMMAAGDDAGLPEPICHIHHLDLISDPVSTVESVYRHFSMDLAPETMRAIERYVAVRPKGGYGEHHYDFADHGLHEKQERERFKSYMVRFGVAPESLSRRRSDRTADTEAAMGEQVRT